MFIERSLYKLMVLLTDCTEYLQNLYLSTFGKITIFALPEFEMRFQQRNSRVPINN